MTQTQKNIQIDLPMLDSNKLIAQARGIHKSFGRGLSKVHVLRGLDLDVRRGEFLAVMGPSGCGKTTLLHILGLMTPQDDGDLLLQDNLVGEDNRQRTLLRRTAIGLVFQRFNLLGVLNGLDNIKLSLRVRGVQGVDRMNELLDDLGISQLGKRKPCQMSIGEQQRFAVARALAHRPALLLADEPTGSLDSTNSKALLEIFRRLNRQERQSIIMITHSEEAARYADRVVHMKDGQIER